MSRPGLASALLALALAVASAEARGEGCGPVPDPVRSVQGTVFYTDRGVGSVLDPALVAADRAAQRPLDGWLDAIQRATERAAARRRAGDAPGARAAAGCALAALDGWALAGALLDEGGFNRQGRYHRAWALSGAALAYRRLRREGPPPADLDAGAAARVHDWMREVAGRVRADFDGPDRAAPGALSDRRNNLSAWAGLAVAASGAATGDRALLDWGAGRLRAQLAQVTAEGALPGELARGRLALHYHLFALQPVAATERVLADEGVALSGEERDAVRRLTRFVLDGAREPGRVAALAGGAEQADPWNPERPRLHAGAGLEVRARAEPDPALDAALAPFRPYRARWLGGAVTGAAW